MNKKIWRQIHRWIGLLLAGFVIFYCVTGVLLNHRQEFDYFQTKQKNVSVVDVPSLHDIQRFIDTCKKQINRDDNPKVIRIKEGGVIEFLYGSHGRVTYVIDSGVGTMTRIEKLDQQPWNWLNRLHKVSKTSDGWRLLADGVVCVLLLLTLTGLFLLRYSRQDVLLLLGGLGLLFLGFVIA